MAEPLPEPRDAIAIPSAPLSPPSPGSSLPIESCLGAIVAGLPLGGSLLLQAPPGAGKTTRVPLALLEALSLIHI